MMRRFILRRLLITLPMVLAVVSITWGLIRLAPGNFYTGEKPLPPAIERNIREKYGLDRPWYVQYGRMLGNVVQGDFGVSLRYAGTSVNSCPRRLAGVPWLSTTSRPSGSPCVATPMRRPSGRRTISSGIAADYEVGRYARAGRTSAGSGCR